MKLAFGNRLPEWSTKIRELRGDRTQAEFAAACDVNQNTVSRWENGVDEPAQSAYAKLAMLSSGVDREYFLQKSGLRTLFEENGKKEGLWHTRLNGSRYYTKSELRPPPPTPTNDFHLIAPSVTVPLITHAVCAGTPAAKNVLKHYLQLPMEYIGDGVELCAITLSDEGMAPIISRSGFVVLDVSSTKPELLVDEMVAVRVAGGEVVVRWLRKDGNVYFLVPEQSSPDYPIRQLQPKLIVGKVVFVGRRCKADSRKVAANPTWVGK
jgi:SOS-response transcriptional repressor LexA